MRSPACAFRYASENQLTPKCSLLRALTVMKTYPEYREDGTLHSFEVTSMWLTLRPLFSILNSISGISDVKRNWFKDDRITFKYFGQDGVVNEPWGDSSRYWIGLSSANETNEPSIEPIEKAFREYQRTSWIWFWQRGSNDS